MSAKDNKELRQKRHMRIRKSISGTASRPRFCVSVTANHIYCQFIDDENGVTLAAKSTLSPEFKAANEKPNVKGAEFLGKLVSDAAKAVNIETVVFDRCGFKYHGRVKAIAEAARANGLKF